MVNLNCAQIVMLRFSFSNPDAIPGIVRAWSSVGRKPAQSDEKPTTKSGKMVINNKKQCDLGGVSNMLEDEGYKLVDVCNESREAVNREDYTARYYSVDFIFARMRDGDEQHPQLKEVNEDLLTALECMCEEAYWKVLGVFENPFYRDGLEIPDKTMVSINMVHRIPRYNNEGNPVTARRHDANGSKIGNPVPLEPLHNLKIENGELSVELCTPQMASL